MAKKQEARLLMTAANGMQVWIPESRLEQWQAAQAAQQRNTQERRESRSELSSKIASALLGRSTSAEKT